MLLLFLFTAVLAAQQQDLLASGQKAFLSGDLASAETIYREYLKQHPDSAEGLSNLAAVLARREQFSEAVSLYEKALKADPGLTPVHFNLAVALIRAGEPGRAAPHLKTFLKSHPRELRARELLGLCLIESGELEEALAELEAVRASKPNEPGILFSLAYAYARLGRDASSRELLARLEAFPAQSRLIEGLVDYRQGRYDVARKHFEEALRHDANLAPAHAALGRLNLLENQDAVAIQHLEAALKLSPHDAESTYQLGVLYDRTGRTEEGKHLLRRAIVLRASYADPYYQLARIAFREKQYQEASKLLDTAVRILPDQESIRFLRARTYQALGRQAEAKAEFDEVRRLKQLAEQRRPKTVPAEIPLEP
ncbi:MAG: tetratricopeptide repeat protein [Bryobacteraceae bacterium]